MRTEGELKLESQVFNENTGKLIEPIEIKNSYYNFNRIYSEIAGGFAQDTPRGENKGPILNFGSGPSMEDFMPYIKDWKGPIMCGTYK